MHIQKGVMMNGHCLVLYSMLEFVGMGKTVLIVKKNVYYTYELVFICRLKNSASKLCIVKLGNLCRNWFLERASARAGEHIVNTDR